MVVGGYDAALNRFIEHWGERAATWGIPRTMGQIHALLFATGETLSLDDVMERLHMSRGGASTNMRALVGWRLARRVPRPADRRDYYVSEGDATELFLTVLAERKRREIDPTIAELRHCLRLLPGQESDGRSERFRERVGGLLMLLEDLDSGFEAIQDDLATLVPLLADRELMVHLRAVLPLLADPAVRAALIEVMMDLKADGALPNSPGTSRQPRP